VAASDEATRRGGCSGASVRSPYRFDKENVRLFLGDRAVRYSLGNNEDFAWAERDITFVHADRNATFEDEKEIICVRDR
jgi:hypothetical protein